MDLDREAVLHIAEKRGVRTLLDWLAPSYAGDISTWSVDYWGRGGGEEEGSRTESS